MGNSLRSTFGNMCGGESSKDVDPSEDQRPIEKPKENKKKEKKNKKNKKLKNGNLTEIKEEEKEPEKENDTTLPVEGKPSEDQTQEEPTAPTEAQSKISLTLKEQASATDLTKVNTEHDDDSISDVIEADHADAPDYEEVRNTPSPESLETPNSRKGRFDSDISRGQSSSEDDIDKKLDHIHRVEAIKPEVLSIGYADEIFEESAREYLPFVEKNNDFKTAVLEFEKSVDPDKDAPDFERCWKLYTELLDQENERAVSDSMNRTSSRSEVDVCDVNVNLQTIRATGALLLVTIEKVRPQVEKCVAEAGTVDVIEYVKGKMVEGEQLGITSKFSAPGKYRRNMKQLKSAVRQLDDVESDTKYILDSVDTRLKSVALTPQRVLVEDDEGEIVPTQRLDESDEDIFAKLEFEPGTDGSVDDKKIDPNTTLLDQAKVRPNTPTSYDETYIIQTIPERSDEKKSTPSNGTSLSPLAKNVLDPLPKSPVHQVVVEEEEHNTLDFGKYIFIDPSTGDIQVMRNRSRSLDSLVSMTSNRSSISRFGSFEFVTDFEINIAEKNQQLKK